MIVIGIDPGVTGAIAIIDHRGACVVHDLPVVPLQHRGRNKRKLDARGLYRLIRREVALIDSTDEILAVVEDVHVMPSGKSANTSLMHSKGIIEGVLGCTLFDVSFVGAQAWKKVHGVTAEKSTSIARAIELFPRAAGHLTRKKDHGRAEALLIANWGLRCLT